LCFGGKKINSKLLAKQPAIPVKAISDRLSG
jgi:hypothetical protein